MAGSAMQDYDCLEDGFQKLVKSKVIVADYSLLLNDFPELRGLNDESIDNWML